MATLDVTSWPALSEQAVDGWRGGLRRAGRFAWLTDPEDYIPIFPVATGLVANTLIYAVAAMPLVAVPISLIRRRRAKAGECTHCRYPILGLALCPECGHPTPSPPPMQPLTLTART